MRRLVRVMLTWAAAPLLLAAVPEWSPAPWLTDLAQMRTAVERSYPNLGWLTADREVSLDRLFGRASDAIRASHSDADARRVMDRLVERFRDGHLALNWPAPTPTSTQPSDAGKKGEPMTAASFCRSRGYDAGQVTAGTAAALPGYRRIESGSVFPAGLIEAGGGR